MLALQPGSPAARSAWVGKPIELPDQQGQPPTAVSETVEEDRRRHHGNELLRSCAPAGHRRYLVCDLVSTRIPKKFGFDARRDIQVLSPMNRGGLGTQVINVELQKVLNPNPLIKIERFGHTFAPRDKVMVTMNDYDKDVFNGDIGFISEINMEDQITTVDFEGKKVDFDFGEMDMLQLAYAITIHKSQGSEYPVVIFPVHMQHYMMLRRNLVYTGVTRGKKLVRKNGKLNEELDGHHANSIL